MNPWNTTTGPKQKCRQRFIDDIASHIDRPTDFFVLPSEDAHDVYLIKERWPASRIRGVERDKKMWNTIREMHLGVDTYPLTVTQYLDREDNSPTALFDAAFIDYVGWMNRQNYVDVVRFATNLTKKDFILAVTFQKNYRKDRDIVRQTVLKNSCLSDEDIKTTIDYDSNSWNTPMYLADAICGGIDKVSRNIKELRVLHCEDYRANEKSTEMTFMSILIKKH